MMRDGSKQANQMQDMTSGFVSNVVTRPSFEILASIGI
jgi:hypothetical protein